MKESEKRINYISSYISAYEEKIKILNKEGLFDSAKLFELFAIEASSLYFGQKLTNLNKDKFTYPAVDLISNDGSFYVQVSTATNIPDKIKYTLEKIQESKDPVIRKIKVVKFFVLNNESISKVKSLDGKNKIGNISFNKDRDLISTKTIIDKAISDLDFQLNLYEFLLKEEKSIYDNLTKWKNALLDSKACIESIDCKINNEYEIDRQELVESIKKKANKSLSIQGNAGSGKSVL